MEEKNFIGEFPYGCSCFTLVQIEKELCLKKICSIATIEIARDNKEFENLIKVVNEKCLDKHVWGLFGNNGEDQWIPLQVASISQKGKDIRREIRIDFNRMLPFSLEDDKREWKSYFHGTVMEVREGQDSVCQKYQKIKKLCDTLMIAIVDEENKLQEFTDGDISKYQKFEIELAKKIKPLFWNPSPRERKYL